MGRLKCLDGSVRGGAAHPKSLNQQLMLAQRGVALSMRGKFLEMLGKTQYVVGRNMRRNGKMVQRMRRLTKSGICQIIR